MRETESVRNGEGQRGRQREGEGGRKRQRQRQSEKGKGIEAVRQKQTEKLTQRNKERQRDFKDMKKETSVPTIILICVICKNVDNLYKWETFQPKRLHQNQNCMRNLALMKAFVPKSLTFI